MTKKKEPLPEHRIWTREEMSQLKEDWRRTGHRPTQVAELHACTRADVIEALGLTDADIKRPKKAQLKCGPVAWETNNPEKAAYFVKMVDSGEKMADACKAVGINLTNTGYAIYNRIKEREAIMSNEQKITEAVEAAITKQPEQEQSKNTPAAKPAKPANKAKQIANALDSMSVLVDVLNRKKLLSEDDVIVCERVMAVGDAFRSGIEYGEALKNV